MNLGAFDAGRFGRLELSDSHAIRRPSQSKYISFSCP
jgi:hypothetical protein